MLQMVGMKYKNNCWYVFRSFKSTLNEKLLSDIRVRDNSSKMIGDGQTNTLSPDTVAELTPKKNASIALKLPQG